MNLKEYLVANKSPLLDNHKNIFILEWLEGNALCTPVEISKSTKIPLTEVSEILQILYKNTLVTFDEEKYKITSNGISILNKLGFSDLQIKNLLAQTSFQADEYAIYKHLFETWRSDFLDFYLAIFRILRTEGDDIYRKYSSDSDTTEISKKDGYTIFLATLLHEFGHILYTDETSKLMKHYSSLSNYCMHNYCISSEIYHLTGTTWKMNPKKITFSKYVSNYLKEKIKNVFVIISSSIDTKTVLQQTKLVNLIECYTSNNINHDFDLSHKMLNNVNLLNNIFASQSIAELSTSLNITELQAKFILKCIHSKVDTLLSSDTTSSEKVSSSENYN